MADLDDDFDLDEDLDLDEDTTGVEGESTNRPEFGVEDEELDDDDDLDDDDLDDADLTPEEVLRRAMADELDEEEEKKQQ